MPDKTDLLAVIFSFLLVTSVVSGVGLAAMGERVTGVEGIKENTSKELNKKSTTVITDCSSTQVINTGFQEVIIDSDLSTSADTCIEINASNIVLKGQNHKIEGSGGTGAGIDVGVNSNQQLENITIKNVVKIKNFGRGIGLFNVKDAKINTVKSVDNGFGIVAGQVTDGKFQIMNISKNQFSGILLQSSTNVTVTDGKIFDNGDDGIRTVGTDRSTIKKLDILENGRDGVSLSHYASPLIGSNNNKLTKLTIKNNTRYGINIDRSEGNNVTGNFKILNSSTGVFLNNSLNNDIGKNTINKSTSGIVLRNSTSNNITQNKINDSAYGIYNSFSSKDNRVIENHINNSVNYGIFLFENTQNFEGANSNIIKRNTIKRSGSSGSFGVAISDRGEKNNIIDNEIKKNERGIILLGNDSEVRKNQIYRNNKSGILIQGSLGGSNNTVKSNEIWRNKNGIKINRSSHDNKLINNTITKPSTNVRGDEGYAIFVNQSSHRTKIIDNVVKDYFGNGIYVWFSNDTVIKDSLVHNTSADGFSIYRANRTTVDNVTSTENRYEGILSYESYKTKIKNSTAMRNRYNGIYTVADNRSEIVNNNATKNGDWGIQDIASNHTKILNNTATNNSQSGFLIWFSNNTKTVNNTASNNPFRGFYIRNSNHTMIVNNTAVNNTGQGFWVRSGTNNTIYSNNATENSGPILLSETEEANVSSNKFIRNKVGPFLLETNRSKIAHNIIRNTTGKPSQFSGYGIFSDSSHKNLFINNTLEDINWIEFGTHLSKNTVQSLHLPNTTVSFTAKNIFLREVGSPSSSPSNRVGIGKYLNITKSNQGSVHWIDLDINYSGSEVSNVKESSLKIWRKMSSGWSKVSGSSVDEQNNRVSANLTSFSVFGVFGNKSSTNPGQISSCTIINKANRPASGVVELTQDISSTSGSDCIEIKTDDIVFDGNGHNITANSNNPQNNIKGIIVKNSSKTLTNVTVKNVELTNWDAGVMFENVNDSMVMNVKTQNGLGDGIYLKSSKNNTLKNITSTSNTGNGTRFVESNRTKILDSRLKQNGESGVFVLRSGEVVVHNNTVTDNNQAGLSRYSGITVIDSNRIEVTNNRVHRNTKFGVKVRRSEKGYFAHNRITENCGEKVGFIIMDTKDTVIESNNVSNNTGLGMKIEGPPSSLPKNITVRDTKINDNGISGLDIVARDSKLVNVTASGHELTNQFGSGINLFVSGSGIILEEVEVRNGFTGISLTSNDTEIRNSTLSGNNWSVVARPIIKGKNSNATLDNVSVGSVEIVSGELQDVRFKEETSPPSPPSNKEDIGKFLNASNTTKSGYLDIKMGYENSDASGVEEDSLAFWKHDGSSWSEVPGSKVDENDNTVSANLSSFSVFGPLGNKSSTGTDIQYSNLKLSKTSVNVSEKIRVSAKIENTGSKQETYNASLKVDGKIRSFINGTLPAGSTTKVSFQTSFSSQGSYDVTIDGLSPKTVTVTKSGAVSIEEAIANLKSQNDYVNFSELQSAISFWIQNKKVPGTGGKTIKFSKLQELISLWISETKV